MNLSKTGKDKRNKGKIRWMGLFPFFLVWLFFCLQSQGMEKQKEELFLPPESLYAKSAVLMDGNSGRVLYEKNGKEFLPNASTTKILTCIIALENANCEDTVTVSSYAASMPDVQLHIREKEQYYLKDLLYSLMLESHNDSAVAIAEHIAGSCEKFSEKMNQKAREIGCANTCFLTPNGLDAQQKGETAGEKEGIRTHGTTAEDLAKIMKYCIEESPQKNTFLEITATPVHTFTDVAGGRSFVCRNHNAFLQMMEGAISGKTGFTTKAGYCYVGAVIQEEKCMIVTLLACGWPGNKHYKWMDAKKLFQYGLQKYELVSPEELPLDWGNILEYEVANAKTEKIEQMAKVTLRRKQAVPKQVLLAKEEKLTVKVEKKPGYAPIKEGEIVGRIQYYINHKKWWEEPLFCETTIEKRDFIWCIMKCITKIVV